VLALGQALVVVLFLPAPAWVLKMMQEQMLVEQLRLVGPPLPALLH
jgi:hypothetical protein